jgi:hypothetical protein
MGELLAIDPDIHFPLLQVFKTGDGFNKERGTWFYRNQAGHMEGPFKSETTANMHLLNTNPVASVPMREPFQQGEYWWWKRDTVKGIAFDGPYECQLDAASAIQQHIRELNQKANP